MFRVLLMLVRDHVTYLFYSCQLTVVYYFFFFIFLAWKNDYPYEFKLLTCTERAIKGHKQCFLLMADTSGGIRDTSHACSLWCCYRPVHASTFTDGCQWLQIFYLYHQSRKVWYENRFRQKSTAGNDSNVNKMNQLRSQFHVPYL